MTTRKREREREREKKWWNEMEEIIKRKDKTS
jgi:hypothetical protein